MWGPRGKPCVVTADADMVKAILKTQWSGQRHRMPGTAAAKAKVNVSEDQLQILRNELREELIHGMAQSLISVKYCEPHLIWSMDIFEKWHHGIKFHVLQVIDLGSRIKLEPLIKESALTGDEIAEHINMLMHFHGAPLFLKRDNGTNLNSDSILAILNLFGAIPVNSPPYCPRYNGVMERSQGETKRYLNVICKDETKEFDIFSACVHMAIMRANGRKRNVLGGRTAQEVWDEEYLHFSKREREAIYNELKILAAKILDGFSAMQRNAKGAVESAWRKAVRTYMEEKEYIRLYRDGKPLRSAIA